MSQLKSVDNALKPSQLERDPRCGDIVSALCTHAHGQLVVAVPPQPQPDTGWTSIHVHASCVFFFSLCSECRTANTHTQIERPYSAAYAFTSLRLNRGAGALPGNHIKKKTPYTTIDAQLSFGNLFNHRVNMQLFRDQRCSELGCSTDALSALTTV